MCQVIPYFQSPGAATTATTIMELWEAPGENISAIYWSKLKNTSNFSARFEIVQIRENV